MISVDDEAAAFRLSPDDSACTVLIAEVDDRVRMQLASLLTAARYRVKVAATGEEAMRMFDEEPCHIVLADWTLPDVDGIAFCRRIRSLQAAHYVYVLMLAAQRGKRDVVAAVAAGADDILASDVSKEELLVRLAVGRRITSFGSFSRRPNSAANKLRLVDPLTNVGNRRFLTKNLPREFNRCRRYGHSLAVLTCDLDGFRRINDGFGHEAGDEILQAFCERASSSLRSADWIARVGGNEFVVVLPETDLDGAAVVANRIREAMGSRPVTTAAGPLTATVSIGYTAVVNPTDMRRWTSDDMQHTADEQLQKAKREGHDRCCGSLVSPSSSMIREVKKTPHAAPAPAALRVMPSAARAR
jgi:two-component system cell cycle response regulator